MHSTDLQISKAPKQLIILTKEKKMQMDLFILCALVGGGGGQNESVNATWNHAQGAKEGS